MTEEQSDISWRSVYWKLGGILLSGVLVLVFFTLAFHEREGVYITDLLQVVGTPNMCPAALCGILKTPFADDLGYGIPDFFLFVTLLVIWIGRSPWLRKGN